MKQEYSIIFGVEKVTFITMVEVITNEYENIHKKGAEKMV